MCDRINKQNENVAIDILRFMCAILIIAIHTKPFITSSYSLYLLIQVVSRLAVPIFFTITGIYCLGDAIDYKNGGIFLSDKVLCAIIKLVKLYLCWSIVYVIYLFFFGKNYSSLSQMLWFTRTYLKRFFIEGTSAHLWFVLAEIYWLLIIYICFRRMVTRKVVVIGSGFLYITGTILNVFSLLPEGHVFTFVRQYMFLPPAYLMLGYVIGIKMKGNRLNINVKVSSVFTISIFILYLGELYIRERVLPMNDLTFSFTQAFVVASVLLLCLNYGKSYKCGRLIRDIANNIYFVHVLIIYIITRVCVYEFGMSVEDIDNTWMFLLDILFSLAAAVFVIAVNNSIKRKCFLHAIKN